MTNTKVDEIDVSDAMSLIAAGDIYGLQFLREGTHANDTITTMQVIGLLLEYT